MRIVYGLVNSVAFTACFTFIVVPVLIVANAVLSFQGGYKNKTMPFGELKEMFEDVWSDFSKIWKGIQ